MSIIKQSLICVVIAAYLCACASIPEHVSAPQDDHVRSEDRAADVDKRAGPGGAVAPAVAAVAVVAGVAVAAPELLPILAGVAELGHGAGVGRGSGHIQRGRGYNQKEYKISHILVATEDEAKAIAADLNQGKDFGTMAKEKSKDSGSSQNGGELGWLYLDGVSNQFNEAARNLKKGEISKPVKTEFGWHIIKLDDIRGVNSADAPN